VIAVELDAFEHVDPIELDVTVGDELIDLSSISSVRTKPTARESTIAIG
jgi:hypothetical protein